MGGGIIIGRERGGGPPLCCPHAYIPFPPVPGEGTKNRFEMQNPKIKKSALRLVWERETVASIKYRNLVSHLKEEKNTVSHTARTVRGNITRKNSRQKKSVFAHLIFMTLKDWETSVGSRRKFPLCLASFRIRPLVFFLQPHLLI